MGDAAKLVPVALAQLELVIKIVTVDGTIIFILPSEVIGSFRVIEKVYEVLLFTEETVIAAEPVIVLVVAVNVVVPYIF